MADQITEHETRALPPEIPAETPSGANLTIQDLSTAMQIIQVVGSRGAIKAEEMTVVGALYTKLKAFLDVAAEASKAKEEETTGDQEPEKPETKLTKKIKKIQLNPAEEIIGKVQPTIKGKT